MKKLIVANWKMNPQSLKEAEDLIASVAMEPLSKDLDLVICPPFEYIEPLINHPKIKNKAMEFGAQDVFYENKGAYTGEISPKMLKDLGVEYVIVGHSERRKILNETDKVINKKVLAALSDGLKVILCVGENSSVRKKGDKVVENYVRSQLEKDLIGVKSLKLKIKNLVIAYEPVWAIGTGDQDTPEDAVKVISFIKTIVKSQLAVIPKVLYGGSVDSKNIKSFLQNEEIDGALVGGASINKKEFSKLLENSATNEGKKSKK